MIEQNIAASLPDDFVPEESIGFPIRASDKCKGHEMKHSAKGEYKCVEFEEYMQVAYGIRKMDPSVNTIVLTSEDEDIIKSSKNFEIYKGLAWRFVYNTVDVHQGTGSATALKKEKAHGKGIMQVMQSALTSMHLQLRTKYIATVYTSSWLLLIQSLHRCDQCTAASERQSQWISVGGLVQWFC